MGVLDDAAKTYSDQCAGEARVGSLPTMANISAKQSSQFQELCGDFRKEAEQVEKLIYKLDELLEPVYYNGPNKNPDESSPEKSFFGDTQVNAAISDMASTMRNVRYKLEKIVKNINLL